MEIFYILDLMYNKLKTKTMTHKLIKFILIFVLITTIISCHREKGRIKIYGVTSEVQNCSVPYIVKFVTDLTYQESEVSYNWDFGDGKTAADRDPVHVYEKPGIYTVTFTIKNYDVQEQKTLVVDIQNQSIPVISSFDYETVFNYYAPAEFKFRNNSKYESSILWNFGDGFGSTDTVLTHTYQTPGTYSASLKAICTGDTATSSVSLSILAPPKDIIIKKVTVWLPSNFINVLLDLEIKYDIFTETPIGLNNITAGSYPVSWNMYQELFFFGGDYDSNILSFVISDYNAPYTKIATFAIPTATISEKHYPNILTLDNGSGYSAEIQLDYIK